MNEEGQPIGPNEKTVSEFGSFLGTIARSSDFCPLNYTNWKALDTDPIWDYANVLTSSIWTCVLAYLNELDISNFFFFVAKIHYPEERTEGCVFYYKWCLVVMLD